MSKGLASVKTLTAKQIADKFKLPLSVVAKKIAAGVKVEKEHTTSTRQANEIARDHLGERPDYYDKLDKMEKTKVVKEMDTSGMPVSKNIEDRRSDTVDKSKVDPAGFTPTSQRMSYNIDKVSTAAIKPGLHNQTAIDSDKYELARDPKHSKDISNLVRNVRENTTVTAGIGGLGFNTGTPAIAADNAYTDTNSMSYDDVNGAILKMIKDKHDKHLVDMGFTSYSPNEIQNNANRVVKEAKHPLQANYDKYVKGKLNELGEYDNKGGMSGYEGVSGPIRAVRKNEMTPIKERSTGKMPADMAGAAERGIYEISAELVGKVSNARFWRKEAPSKTLTRAINKKFVESGKKKDNSKHIQQFKEETKMDNKELINEALDCILEDNLPEMKDNLMKALQEKAMEKLEERKKEIAANYFAQ